MTAHDVLHATAAGVGLLLIAIFTIPTLIHLITSRARLLKANGYATISGFYEDGDGEATEESTKAYSDFPPRVAAWLSSALGLAASIAAGVLSRDTDTSNSSSSPLLSILGLWSDVAAWSLIFVQIALLPRRGDYHAKYRLANFGLGCTVILLVSLVYRSELHLVLKSSQDSKDMARGLCWLLQCVSAVFAFFAFGSIPRRPDVYVKGALLDQQYTVSLFGKISFSWNPVVFNISKQRQLEMEDLPVLDSLTRSRNLYEMFTAKGDKGRLWYRLLKFHYIELAQQWVLVFVSAVLSLFPQYMMYNLLSRLEQVRVPEASNTEAVAWALALCLSLTLDNIVGGILSWWTNSRLVTTLGAVLQSLVFHKALNEHETATPPKKKDEEAEENKDAGKSKGKEEKKDDTRQSVINHMKLDSGRVTMFCSFNYYLPLAVVKLVLAGGFLIVLLGWKAVVAGLLAAFSSKYLSALLVSCPAEGGSILVSSRLEYCPLDRITIFRPGWPPRLGQPLPFRKAALCLGYYPLA